MPGAAYVGHDDHDDHDDHDVHDEHHDHDRHDDKLEDDCEDDWGKNKRPREQKCLALCIHRTPSTHLILHYAKSLARIELSAFLFRCASIS